MKSIIERAATFDNETVGGHIFESYTDDRTPVCLFVCCLTAHQHYLGH